MYKPLLWSIALIVVIPLLQLIPLPPALWQALPRGQRGEWAETAAELAPRARSLVDAGDVVLVKGSKGSKVSLVVDALRKLGQAVATKTTGAE